MYPIIDVQADAPEDPESLGSKPKFWYASQKFLFKEARTPSGEDWAEKVCAEVAGLLGLPHAKYELALWHSVRKKVPGVVSWNLCNEGQTLLLGNELLSDFVPKYDEGISKFRVSAHTVERVLSCVSRLEPRLPLGWNNNAEDLSPETLFIGYILLGALVGNTDRHHENWGAIRTEDGRLHLAPTFDHASSLGCHESEEKKDRRLNTRDSNFTVEAFAARARSALYRNEQELRPLLTRDTFLEFARRLPSAGLGWLARLATIPDAKLAIIVDNVPPQRLTQISAEFAKRLMVANKKALLEMMDTF